MSRQQALGFLEELRDDPSLRGTIASRQAELTLDDVVALAAARGRRFTRAELERAFRDDWTMRLMHRRRGTRE